MVHLPLYTYIIQKTWRMRQEENLIHMKQIEKL
jgi:hypothetical protein